MNSYRNAQTEHTIKIHNLCSKLSQHLNSLKYYGLVLSQLRHLFSYASTEWPQGLCGGGEGCVGVEVHHHWT